MKNALASAKTVLANSRATQEEVDSAVKELQTAIDALEEKKDVTFDINNLPDGKYQLYAQMIKTDRVTVEHSGSVDASGSGIHADKRLARITLRQNAAEDRAYIESCFGRSLYPPERLRKAEQELCTGDHLGCHLWFAAGVPSPEQAPTPEAKHLAEQAQLQADRNRAYYAKNRELHRSVVLRLTEQIRNCILVHQQPHARVARSGSLDPVRVWRAPVLDDARVFRCAEEENQPAFTVDLLLDASASRLHCQEVIAAQGVILAESLTACGIPVRVSGRAPSQARFAEFGERL
jgi:hypothetical protein